MATVAARDFIVTDFLADLNLKPWWETWRGHGVTVAVATALAIDYLLQTGISMTCLPDTNNTSILRNYTTTEANFVNNYCFSQGSRNDIHVGTVAIANCFAVIFFSSYWLHIPGVMKALKSYVDMRTAIEELNMTAEQLKTLSISKRTEENAQSTGKVHRACSKVCNYNVNVVGFGKSIWIMGLLHLSFMTLPFLRCRHYGLRALYISRNCILICIFIVTAYFGQMVLKKSWYTKIPHCIVSDEEVEIILGREYVCAEKFPRLVFELAIIFIVGSCLQVVCLIIGIILACWPKCNKTKTKESRRNFMSYINFNDLLWRNSRCTNPGIFEEFCDFISNHAEKCIREQFEQNPDSTNLYLIEIFTMLSSDWGIIAGMIYQQIKKKDFKCGSEEYRKLVEIVNKIPQLKWCEELESLLDCTYDEKYFELFASLLSIERNKSDEINVQIYLKKRKVNLNAIGQPYEKGESLLYYVLLHSSLSGTERNKRKLAKAIVCTCPLQMSFTERISDLLCRRNKEGCNEKRKTIFVHYDGKSKHVEEFVKSQRCKIKSCIGLGHHSPKIEGCTATSTDGSSENKHGIGDILEIKEEFDERVRAKESHAQPSSWSDIAQKISHFKFKTWTTQINEFAENIRQEEQWEVLVALMNSLIIEEKQDGKTNRVIPNCNLDLSRDVNPAILPENSNHSNSLLYFAFTKRDYAPLTLTAAATIIDQIHANIRKKPSKEEQEDEKEEAKAKVFSFIKQLPNVPLHQKVKLIALFESIYSREGPSHGDGGVCAKVKQRFNSVCCCFKRRENEYQNVGGDNTPAPSGDFKNIQQPHSSTNLLTPQYTSKPPGYSRVTQDTKPSTSWASSV